jgi:hypothetical protein
MNAPRFTRGRAGAGAPSGPVTRGRLGAVAFVGALAFIAASCSAPPTTFSFGPFTVPVPRIGAAATPVDYAIDVPGIPSVQLTPYIPPREITPYIPPQEITPNIPPRELTPYIPPVCVPFVGCSPAVPATYSPAVPATYSPAVPATYSPEVPATYSQAIPGGSCIASYTPPAFFIDGVTATLPQVNLDVATGTVTIPNVTVNIPAATVAVGSGSVGCSVAGLPPVQLPTGDVLITFPAQAVVQNATLDLSTRVLTLSDPSFTVTGVGLQFIGLHANFALPNITIPLPTLTVPLA